MKIDDEKLSAFLDAELPEVEMESIRAEMAENEELSLRLAELASADRMVAAHYSAIDSRPLPRSLQDMLAEDETAKVIHLPLWRRANQRLQSQLREHAAMAAGIALSVGLAMGHWLPGGQGPERALAQALDTTPSGAGVELANGDQLSPRLSFINRSGEYCRQFQLQSASGASENIACRNDNGSWGLAASIKLDAVQAPGSYQPASGGRLLDSALDQMMTGDALDRQAEDQAIAREWQ